MSKMIFLHKMVEEIGQIEVDTIRENGKYQKMRRC
jgi:hypothetical protein